MNSGNNFKRLFLAISVNQEYISFLTSFREANKNIKNIRWTAPVNLHLTLCFIGNVNESKINKVISIIENLSQKTKSFSLEFKENRYAPKKSHPTMIWTEFKENSDFADLYHSLHQNLSDHLPNTGSHKDPIPHITLARLKCFSKDPFVEIKELPEPLIVNKIELWESKLSSAGSQYFPVKSFILS